MNPTDFLFEKNINRPLIIPSNQQLVRDATSNFAAFNMASLANRRSKLVSQGFPAI